MGHVLGQGTGPLRGVKVVELAGIGPGPHACMILADLGADVIRIDRPGGNPLGGGPHDVLTRGRPSVALDLKHPDALATVLELVEQADLLVEGMRPGTAERLGLGPQECLARNPRLVYGRMTGWGQDGPWSQAAGHDMNYIAITGALHGLGQDPDRPHFPSNLLGDFGGGSTYLVIGLLAALLEARTCGEGQVVDAAIVDGTAHLNAIAATVAATGADTGRRRSGLLDGGTPWYDVYETRDGRHLSVGALEPQFFAQLVDILGVPVTGEQYDRATWPAMREAFVAAFASRTRQEWAAAFEGTDACVAPVLSLAEAADHPHLAARGTFVRGPGGGRVPGPAPRLSGTPLRGPGAEPRPGADTTRWLTGHGFAADEVAALLAAGVLAQG